jgi:two-component system chemotaxis response regulator CheB
LGTVYVAPRDHHITVDDSSWQVTRGAKVHYARPSIDPLFKSAAARFGARVVGILLSGGGSDGVSGLIAIHGHGGLTIAQHPDEATSPSLPLAAINRDHVHAVLTVEAIAAAIPELVTGEIVDGVPPR